MRKFFIDSYNVDPPIINGDQMPLHRNESSSEKTLSITGYDTYVKENYSLPRERVAVFTQVSSDPKVLVFNPPPGIKFRWATKGSYRLEHMLKTI